MRELAQFAMKGPRNAAGVALVACLIPMLFWLGAAVVALVTLRHGTAKGLNVFLWAAAPSLAWWLGMQDPTALVVLISTFAMAEILRVSVSMRRTLVFAFCLSIVIGVITPLLIPQAIDQLMLLMEDVLKQLTDDAQIELTDEIRESFRLSMIAIFAASFYAMSIGALFLARSWQAALYNPGGWKTEFHQLRLSIMDVSLIVAAMVLGPGIGIDSYLLIFSAMVPVVVSGLALVHGLVGMKQLGGHWMIGFYALVIVLFPTFLAIVAMLALFDAAIDIRSKVQASPDGE